MKSLESNILMPNESNATLDDAKHNYNTFIGSLLSNPLTTKKDRERIVALMLKERDKGFVTEERVKELIQQYYFVPTTPSGDSYTHNPKNMVSFLYQFSINDKFKWFTHEPDADFEFDYDKYMNDVVVNDKKEYKQISTGVNSSTWNNVLNFISDTKVKTSDYNGNIIKYTWKDLKQWCFEHKFQHPYDALVDNYKFAKYIDIFKNTIEFRNIPKFSDRFEDFICDKALISPDVKPIFADSFYSIGGQLRAYIDIRQLFSAIKEICKWIIENKSKGNRVEISVGENDNSYLLSIFHIDSYMTIDAKKIKGLSGDFHKVRNMLLNVADWSIDADVNNISLHISCLDNTTKYVNNKVVTENAVTELSKKMNGVKHLITIYKNIQ